MSLSLTSFFKNPNWLKQHYLEVETFEGFTNDYINQVRGNLKAAQSNSPVVSIVLTTYNEEANVVRCLDSISRNNTIYPFEIIVVNNNSKDNTVRSLRALGIDFLEQSIQGSGPARQMGLENAKGKYILLGDADCIYPNHWIQKMIERLQTKNTAVVYGRYSFFSEKSSMPRWQLSLYELMRDVSMEIRQVKRPFLNAYGISMAFYRDQGLKEGFIGDARRGNDGRMCFDLMKYGKVRRMRSYKAAAWTGTRTLMRDGSFFKAFWKRLMDNISRIDEFFRPLPDHNTKNSPVADHSVNASISRIKRKMHLHSSHE